jgi:hypothetical protein
MLRIGDYKVRLSSSTTAKWAIRARLAGTLGALRRLLIFLPGPKSLAADNDDDDDDG